MGDIRATCGHILSEEEGRGFPAVMSCFEWFDPALSYLVLCEKCLREYKRKGLILSKRQQKKWLNDEPS